MPCAATIHRRHVVGRIKDPEGIFRIIYVAKFANVIYVLHCFQKKTKKTSKHDIDLAAKRYRELVKELSR
jgi:phage-related protein